MEHSVLWAIWGLYGAMVILGWFIAYGFRKLAANDRILSERMAMQMAQTDGLCKEMARKTDEMARKTDEMARKTDELMAMLAKTYEEMVKANKDTSLFLRAIFERVDKQNGN